MYGDYDIPFDIQSEGLSISVSQEGKDLIYLRECAEDKTEKDLSTKTGKIFINPVEPLNRPKSLTPYFFIKFGKTLVVGPGATKKVYLTFPIEIGIFISEGGAVHLLDVFTLVNQKFTVYGDPSSGFICKYWKSDIYDAIPSEDPLRTGGLELNISNSRSEWVEVAKAVFDAHGMKIYYSDRMVSLKALMKIKSSEMAETEFENSPLSSPMNASLEIYRTGKLSVTSSKFIMEFGI